MVHGVQRTPRCGAQASRLLILGCALALFVAALGLLPTWALAQPAPQPQPAARQTDPISITLSYSEAAPSSEVVPRRSIIDHINAIFAGTEEAPVHAFFRVSVSGKLHKSETEPWRVTLVLSQPQEHIGKQMSQEDNLKAEAQFMMSMLRPWSVELTQEQVEAFQRDGKVSIKLERPMDHLHLWSGPSSITLTVLDPDQVDEIETIRFVRKAGDVFTRIYVVFLHEQFNIQVRFVKSPREAQKTVQLDIGGQTPQQIVIKRTSTDPAVYRSDPLYLVEPGEQIQRRPAD